MKYSDIIKESTPRLEVRYVRGVNSEDNFSTSILPVNNNNVIPKKCLLAAVIRAQIRLCTPLSSFPNNDFLFVSELPDKVMVIAYPTIETSSFSKDHKEMFYAGKDIPVDGLLTILEFAKIGLINGLMMEQQSQSQGRITPVNRFGQIIQ